MDNIGIINVSGNYELKVNPQWNLLQLQTIYLHCDTSTGPVNITLFGISELLKRWNVSIYVVDISENSATYNITVNSAISDFIGSASSNSITINQNGGSATFMPVSEISWAFCTAGSGEFCDITLTPQTIIYGEVLNFTKTDYGSEIDYINPGVTEITRGNNQGIFNIALELGYQFNISPANTGWNADGWFNLLDIKTRSYTDWGTAVQYNPPGSIGAELVMIDYSTNQYYLIKFTQWTQGNAGGGFAYDRQEIVLTEKCKITFSDGTTQDTAAGEVISGTGIDVVKSIGLDGKVTYTVNSLPVPAQVNYSNVLFVDPVFGNNATALAGRFDKPYQSISQATSVAAAMGGSISQRILIYIRKGTYVTNVNLTNWVDFYCEPGVVFNGGGSIRDNGVAVNSNWYGYAKFVSKTAIVMWIQGNSTVNFQFDYIDNSSNSCLRFEPPVGGQCEVLVEGNKIFGTTLGVGYAIAIRRKANVTMNIKSWIWAYHSIFDIRDNYDGVLTVNCPKIRLANDNIYGGNFKQAVISYSSTINSRMTFNADFVNEGLTYLGGISGMIANWSSTSGIIEINGNIYAGQTVGIYASGNQAAGRIAVKGNVYSDIQPVYVASENSCFVSNGVISKPGAFVANAIRTIQNAKLYLSNVQIYHALVDVNMIQLDSITSQLNLYNVVGQGFGPSALSISSVGPINIKSHGSRFNCPLGAGVTDVLTPSGFIYDPLVVVPNF